MLGMVPAGVVRVVSPGGLVVAAGGCRGGLRGHGALVVPGSLGESLHCARTARYF